MKITPSYANVYDYVIGVCHVDPIEAEINKSGNRYEVFDVSIYDYQEKKFYSQPQKIKNFCKKVSSLRMAKDELTLSQIREACHELSGAELEICLTDG